MSTRFENSRRRLDRAYIHGQTFVSEWNTFSQEERPTPKLRKDERAGWHIAFFEPSPNFIANVEAVTSRLALILGEMVYQLRASLDGLIWETITRIQGSEPPSNAANRLDFPILNGTDRNFKKCALHKFPFPQDLKDWLESIQPDSAEKAVGDPDRGLNVTLEDIHNLARFDRHRRLRIVGMVPFESSVEVNTVPKGGGATVYDWLDCDLFNGKYDFLRLKIESPGGLIPYHVSLKTNITLEVVVEDIFIYEGERIGDQLLRFTEAVRHTINVFERAFP